MTEQKKKDCCYDERLLHPNQTCGMAIAVKYASRNMGP